MSEFSPWSIAAAILTSLGGGAFIVAVLFRWLGDLTAKRILQREQSAVLASLEGLKQELSLRRLSYEKHVQHVVEYYAMFYKTYQLCQKTESADIIQIEGKSDLNTKKEYLANADRMADEWNGRQGLLRLILPRKALDLHQGAIRELNTFKDVVKIYDNMPKSHGDLHESFLRFDGIKKQLEECLRDHLRTDHIAAAIS